MSVEDDLGEKRLARLREIRMGVGKVQTPAWRQAALYVLLDIIDELVAMRDWDRFDMAAKREAAAEEHS